MDSPLENPQTGVLWRVEEAFAMYLSPKQMSKRGRRERRLQHRELGAWKMQVPSSARRKLRWGLAKGSSAHSV